MERVERDIWANCASLWARLFVLAEPFWETASRAREDVEEAFLAVLRGRPELYDALARRLQGFDVEDDGTAEWGMQLISSRTCSTHWKEWVRRADSHAA